MKILIVSEWFTPNLTYAENMLPWALASAGHEVHLVTSQANIYFGSPRYKEVYEPLFGPGLCDVGTSEIEGVQITRLPTRVTRKGRIMVRNLTTHAQGFQPDVIQSFGIQDSLTMQAAKTAELLSIPLLTGCHIHESVLPVGSWGRMKMKIRSIGSTVNPAIRVVARNNAACFAISDDAARVAHTYFGVPNNRIIVQPLGVDTEIFSPNQTKAAQEARFEFRTSLGLGEDDVLCVYTGRLSADKDPMSLSRAVKTLRRDGHPFFALFVGAGSQAYIDQLLDHSGSVYIPFAQTYELAQIFRAADIGVWPREESTSQLDAVACGLPIVISSNVEAKERRSLAAGLFEEGNPDALSEALLRLRDFSVRNETSSYSSKRVLEELSWQRLASERVRVYRNKINEISERLVSQ